MTATKPTTVSTDCWAASIRGANYLLRHQGASGDIGSSFILDYYKAPWALVAAGHPVAAWRLLDWIKAHARPRPGQFHSGDTSAEVLRASTYRNVIIMMGALLLSRFDLVSEQALADLREYQHPETGAFYGEEDRATSREMNTNHTAMAGLFCLQAGLASEAKRAGSFICDHLARQPHPERTFYIHTDVDGRLLTDVTPDNRRWRIVDYDQVESHYWAIGTPVAFLAQLYDRFRDSQHLQAAEQLLALTSRFAPGHERWASTGKVAWGAARLYAATRDPKHRALAERLARICFVDGQAADGSWGPFFLHMGSGGAGYQLPTLELTAEFTFLTSEVARCLST